MNIEVGDSFKVDWRVVKHVQSETYGHKFIKCKKPDKIFIIEKFSKSVLTIYYVDDRTNNSCKCWICKDNNEEHIRARDHDYKTISKSFITIFQKKLQRERNEKLKQLGV